ncbi:uncharacterized protein (PEP-CTERM system associated) [Thiogranum longum]|uniref:Uncharacterized protein (PEP-CTERM system associated) n=1 Tax=Thiogranum longum TaxID=1537524 RepID=A0A4R1HF53_9GAMM|nr:hypothetical protein [Thiogranum longum]TCK19391.1 uncharacterized protein (PEP-CTERM system associated) [Thiogranum longum]
MRATFRNITAGLIIISNAGTVFGAEWKIDPTLRLRTGYNDNLRLSTNNEISTAEATFSPDAVFSVTTPTSGASGKVGFDFRRYEEDSDLDDNNTRLDLNTFHNMERSRLGLDLGFIKDTTLDSQLEATGLAFDRIPRRRITVSPNWSYSFNERTRLSASYGYTDVEYNNSSNTAFVNYNLNSGQLALNRVLNEKTTASLTLSGSKSSNDNDIESVNANLQGGVSYRYSETLSASLFIGVRRTEVDFSQTSQIPIFSGNTIIGFVPLTQDISNSDWGSTYSASIDKAFLLGNIGLSASRDISNDINGQPIETTRVRATSLYRFSEILSANLNLAFFNSQSSNNVGNSLNRNYYEIEPTFTWAMKKFWSLSGSYRYRKQTFDDIKDDATQNAAYLTLAYRWPKIAVSR